MCLTRTNVAVLEIHAGVRVCVAAWDFEPLEEGVIFSIQRTEAARPMYA